MNDESTGKFRFERIQLNSPLYEESLSLREEVLRKPLGLKWTDAEREAEARCVHIAGIDGTRVVAILLLQPIAAASVKMRQVAVHPDMQRAGIGSKLVAFAEETARALGFRVTLNGKLIKTPSSDNLNKINIAPGTSREETHHLLHSSLKNLDFSIA